MSLSGFAFREAVGALGALVAVLALAACSGAGSASAPIGRNPQAVSSLPDRAASPSGFIYAANLIHASAPYVGSVAYYPVGSNGDVPPAGIISGSNTQLTQVDGIVVDSNGEIYVADSDTNTIVGFAPLSNGNVNPNVVIRGPNTGLASPIGLALGRAGHLFVANCGRCGFGSIGPVSVEEFAPGSTGNIKPIRKITGSRTQLGQTDGIAVDLVGHIFVANAREYTVTVYAPGAHGNAAPLRVISGSTSGINEPDGIAVDESGLYVDAAYLGYIGRFAHRANGNVPPRSVLHVDWSGGGPSGQTLGGIITAPDGTLYVAGLWSPLIAQYAATASGKPPPLTVISGPDTQLVVPTFVFVR